MTWVPDSRSLYVLMNEGSFATGEHMFEQPIVRVRKAIGNIEGAETKRSLGFHSALTLTPQASYDLIRQRARSAFGRLADFKPLKVQTPLSVEVSFKNDLPSEVLAYLPIFERTDSHSIRFRAKDMVEASAIMSFIGDYRPDLTP